MLSRRVAPFRQQRRVVMKSSSERLLPLACVPSHSAAYAQVADLHVIRPIVATVDNIRPYGHLILPVRDGERFSAASDAHLVLGHNHQFHHHQILPEAPRFYCMLVPPHESPLIVRAITRHKRCTQVLCQASRGAEPWFIALAMPGAPLRCASEVVVFSVTPPAALALHVGTWHAGPLFTAGGERPFYNLELSDTNISDHETRVLEPPHLVPLHVDV